MSAGRHGSAKELPIAPCAKPLLGRLAMSVSPTGSSFPTGPRPQLPFMPGTRWRTGLNFPWRSQLVPSLTKVEIMASEAAFPLKLAPSELTESMLVPLVNQFGLMQQQMFDQFQQAMAMMVQMFGTMHREQMEVIRAELDQLMI